MSEETNTISQRVHNLLGVLIVISIIILIVLLPFMGFSSFATEPNPFLGEFFPLWILLIIIIFIIAFFIPAEKILKDDKNG